MFKATMVDGVYDKDPHKYPDAKKYDTLTFTKVLEDQLAVMDGTAATLCRDTKLPILVFDLADPDNIARAVPVSYTHLDVYKRQAIIQTPPILSFAGQTRHFCYTLFYNKFATL